MRKEITIDKAVAIFDTDVRFAKIMNVTPQAVGKWRKNQVPAGRCIEIEEKTNGEVTRYELRPDIFGSNPVHAANG